MRRPSKKRLPALPHASLSSDDREQLERWIRSPTSPQRLVRRSKIVLMASEGWRQSKIAEAIHVSAPTVRLWIGRWHTQGIDGLLRDAAGRGRRPGARITGLRAKLVAALDADPGRLAGTSIRELARAFGMSPSAVWRVLRDRSQ